MGNVVLVTERFCFRVRFRRRLGIARLTESTTWAARWTGGGRVSIMSGRVSVVARIDCRWSGVMGVGTRDVCMGGDSGGWLIRNDVGEGLCSDSGVK